MTDQQAPQAQPVPQAPGQSISEKVRLWLTFAVLVIGVVSGGFSFYINSRTELIKETLQHRISQVRNDLELEKSEHEKQNIRLEGKLDLNIQRIDTLLNKHDGWEARFNLIGFLENQLTQLRTDEAKNTLELNRVLRNIASVQEVGNQNMTDIGTIQDLLSQLRNNIKNREQKSSKVSRPTYQQYYSQPW